MTRNIELITHGLTALNHSGVMLLLHPDIFFINFCIGDLPVV